LSGFTCVRHGFFAPEGHVPSILQAIAGMIQPVPNLSSRRRDPALVSLGVAIRSIREERELSQEALALLAEVDRSYLGSVERGDSNVAVLTLVRIATALGVTVSELVLSAAL
jgi:DNA-binding XRE family transcriptional regulator